jgi:MOSC domain-containing protein YiiM
MWTGSVAGIYIARIKSQDVVDVDEVRAVAGRGLEGDRYFDSAGTFSDPDKPGRAITLIELEAIRGAEHEYGVSLDPGATRRNIVTSGVPLNHLVDREFTVGKVRLRGVKLCEPCAHMQRLTQKGTLKALIHRGGLRADILTDGSIRVGDRVAPVPLRSKPA